MQASNTVLVIAGPTASGKTRLGILLASELHGEIVSADSMQIYRRMDIGTAKATAEERAEVPHHMLDAAEPSESYSVSRYVDEAGKCCDALLQKGKLPVIVGGTGLYIDSLISGRDFAEIQEDMALRTELQSQYDSLGGAEMLRRLAQFDPERAAKLQPNDSRRIIRAIEVYMLTGQTATERDEETRRRPKRYNAVRIVLGYKDRADLYTRIDRRVDEMCKRGLFDEVEALLGAGLDKGCTAMQAIGYKEAVRALEGEISRSEAAELIKQASRRYAKRQLTWFRRWEDAFFIEWEKTPDFEKARQLSTEFLHSCGVS